MTIIKH